MVVEEEDQGLVLLLLHNVEMKVVVLVDQVQVRIQLQVVLLYQHNQVMLFKILHMVQMYHIQNLII